jgi:hypothetical protein
MLSIFGRWPTLPVSAFYKGESQEKKLSGDWKEQRFCPALQPTYCREVLGGSLFSRIHVAVVTTSSVSDATSSTVLKWQPWFYLRLKAYSFFWLSEGAYS